MPPAAVPGDFSFWGCNLMKVMLDYECDSSKAILLTKAGRYKPFRFCFLYEICYNDIKQQIKGEEPLKLMKFSCGNPTPEIIGIDADCTEEIKLALTDIFSEENPKHILAEEIETKVGTFVVFFDTNTLITGGVEIETALNHCIYVTDKELNFGTTDRIVFAKLENGSYTDVTEEDSRYFAERSKPLTPSSGTYQINLIK